MSKVLNKSHFLFAWSLLVITIHLCAGTAHASIKEGAAAFAADNGRNVLKELTPLAQEGNALALGLLARSYWSGLMGLARNRDLAVDYAKKALPGLIKEAEMENGLAQSTLSVLYREGTGTVKDCAKAVDWVKRSANQNDPFGLFGLSGLYLTGTCLARDTEQAMQLRRKAAEFGHSGAQFLLGQQYARGDRVSKNDQTALHWYQKSADQGSAYAQYALGYMYQNGQGVMQDDSQALAWFRKSAEQGDASGQFGLGFMFAVGRGVTKDEQQALHWYRKAADQGHATSQQHLGFIYVNGRGVPKDPQLAYFWWLLASAQGDNIAKINRDHVEASLTSTQRADAQAAAREWKPNTGMQHKHEPSADSPKEARRTPPPAPQSRDSSGTAWAITRTQLITNAHVVEGCSRLEAQGLGSIQVQAVDPQSDLALLTVANNPRVATLRGTRLRQGEPVTVIGYPLAGLLASGANVTAGNVSALAGMQNDTRHIQISAPVQPGNSGGPLLDASGHVVGVVVSKLNALKVAKATGDIPQNVNFAVSLFTLQGFLEANGVNYATAPSNKNMATADVAEIGKRFTVLLECYK